MKKVYQTRFSGTDSPVSAQGNCFQACIASIFEIPLEEAFDCVPYFRKDDVGKPVDESLEFIELNKWLLKYGFQTIYIQAFPLPRMTTLRGFHLLEVESTTLKKGDTHMVVTHNGDIVHDPNANAKEIGKVVGFYLIVPINPLAFPIVPS
jgi:hypothetical protein